MATADRRTGAADSEIAFDRVLSGGSAERRTALIVFPAVVVLAVLIGFAFVAISRMSGLSTQVQIAQKQVEESNKTIEQRDAQLRDAHSETAVLASAGQGAAVLGATSPDSGASGVALDHPEQHALAVYAFNLAPPPEGQEYRLIVTDGAGQEQLMGAVSPSDRGAGFLLARDVPEGAAKIEIALLPKAAGAGAGAKAEGARNGKQEAVKEAPPATRQPVLVGQLPRPGEAGVVAASATEKGSRAQGRAARRGR